MKYIYLLHFYPLFLTAQIKKDSLNYKIINADSIEITSHEDLFTSTLKDNKPYQYYSEILVNGKPNREIIKESKILNDSSKQKLLTLINTQTPKDSISYRPSCFNPHHSILIYKNGKCSFLDICFGCMGFSSSGDFHFSNFILSTDIDWENLKNYFKEHKMFYKIEN
jgi:hypothetical protein